MQTKRKLILGFLLAGFGLLAACGNDHTGGQSDNKVAEGGDCDADKKCKDDLKCFKKAAGQTGATCQKPCDPQAPNACGSKPNMCKEHELLDGTKDHMCMGHDHGDDKTWHSECTISSDPHEMAHACHPLHASDKAACVTLTGAAHATCEHTCAGGPNDCPKDKKYTCKDVGTQKICVPVNMVVGSVCDKAKASSCFSNVDKLVCVDDGRGPECHKECDPSVATDCAPTEECAEVDSKHFCKAIPVKQAGEPCTKDEKHNCFNASETLECVTQHESTPYETTTCEKACPNGNECDSTTQMCKDMGGKKVCILKPVVGSMCEKSKSDSCDNGADDLVCVGLGGTETCQKKCDPTDATACEAPETCKSVDSQNICLEPYIAGSKCNKTDPSTCAHPSTPLVCVEQNGTSTCEKSCTPPAATATECDPATETCKEVDGQNVCDLNYGQCDAFNKLEELVTTNKVLTTFHDDKASIPSIDLDATTLANGIKQMTFVSGVGAFGQPNSVAYFNLDTGKQVKITDKAAMQERKDWHIGLRAFEFYTKGRYFKGDLVVAKVTGNHAAFQTYVKADAAKLTAADFKFGQVVDDTCTRGQYFAFLGAVGLPLSVAPVLYGATPESSNMPSYFGYDRGTHTPTVATPSVFYVIRKGNTDWYAKLWFENIQPVDGNKVKFTIQYQVLQ